MVTADTLHQSSPSGYQAPLNGRAPLRSSSGIPPQGLRPNRGPFAKILLGPGNPRKELLQKPEG